MPIPDPLSPDRLRRCCDPAQLSFSTTDEIDPLEDPVGQDRAVEAVRFGVGIRHHGYNLFALGPPGSGRYTLIRRHAEQQAAGQAVPSDWCYVNNFTHPHKPRALQLPAGRGQQLRQELEQLVDDIKSTTSATFEGEDYLARRQAIEEEFKQREEQLFNDLQRRAKERNAALIRTPLGFAFAPVRNGEVVSPDVFHKWPKEEQQQVKEAIAELEEELQTAMQQVPQWQREHHQRTRELNHEVTTFAVGYLVDLLKVKFADLPNVLQYLTDLQRDVVEHADDFLPDEPSSGTNPLAALQRSLAEPPSFRRYHANVIVDHGKTTAAPVVHELHPTQPNLIGRIEHTARLGALMTDFNFIKPGALHAANGGYLILDARKVLLQPFAWEALKRAIESQQIRIQGIHESLGLTSTVSLEPEPIPLSVKVILLGDRLLYYLLTQLDPEFPELFKVAVDFEDTLDRDESSSRLLARFIGTIVKREELKPLDAGAVARVIDHAAWLAADSEKLTLHMRPIVDLLREADYWATSNDKALVSKDEVRRAIDAQIHRSDRVRARSQEEIQRGMVLIDTAGTVVGQVNGLAVYRIGEFSFGRPSRITARVRLGRGEVVDIEREVALGGPIHSKGVLILAGFLGERFGRQRPLALSASLVFEQSYGGVEGDSASSAELYALLSALSRLPLKQSYAVTGSVNQHGQVQAVGATNEKIEAFFDTCAARGLTGDQGVLMPASNVPHLMLREDVVQAVEDGRFHIYPVETVDQGIEILTGLPAGEPDADGEFPDGTVNQAIQRELTAFAEKARAFAVSSPDGQHEK